MYIRRGLLSTSFLSRFHSSMGQEAVQVFSVQGNVLCMFPGMKFKQDFKLLLCPIVELSTLHILIAGDFSGCIVF